MKASDIITTANVQSETANNNEAIESRQKERKDRRLEVRPRKIFCLIDPPTRRKGARSAPRCSSLLILAESVKSILPNSHASRSPTSSASVPKRTTRFSDTINVKAKTEKGTVRMRAALALLYSTRKAPTRLKPKLAHMS